MATYISNQTGLWSSASTWLTAAAGTLTPTAAAGVAPVSFGGDKIVIAPGHVVTYNVSGCFGDETSTYGSGVTLVPTSLLSVSANAICLSGGTLKADRTTNIELTARGTIVIGPSGTLDWGTTADPLLSSANITLHYMSQLSALSASLGAAGLYLYGPATENQSFNNNIYINGKSRLRNTFLSVSAANAATVISVVSAAGWQVGDRLVIASEYTSNLTSSVAGVLSSTNIVSITGNNITISPGLNSSRSVGTPISNFTSNVNIKSYNPTYASYGIFCNMGLANSIDINNIHFDGVGNGIQFSQAGVNTVVGWTNYSYTGVRNSTAQTGSPVGGLTFGGIYAQINPFTIKGIAIDNPIGAAQHYAIYINGKWSEFLTVDDYTGFITNTNGYFAGLNTQANVILKNSTCFRATNGPILNTSVPNNVTIDNCYIDTTGSILGPTLNGLKLNVTNSKLRSSNYLTSLDAVQSASIKNSTIYHTSSNGLIILPNPNASGSLNFSNCNFYYNTGTTNTLLSSVTKTAAGQTNKSAQTAEITVFQANNNSFDYRRFNYYHYSQADLNTRKRGITSYKIRPEVANTQFYNYFTIPGIINTPQIIKGSLRFDTNYGTANPPTISFVGAGVNQTFTCGPTANAWQDFTLTLNPTSTDDIIITVACKSSTTTGFTWLDGIPIYPYIQTVRHYGYLFDNNTYRTVNIHNTLSAESTVAALSAITKLDYLYDAATYWSVVNPASSYYIDAVSLDGTKLDFNDKNIVIDTAAASAFNYSINTNTITVKSASLSSGGNFNTIASTGYLSAINGALIDASVVVRTSNFDSELVYSGADNIVLYPSLSDAQNTTNPGPSASNGVLRFLYGQTLQGVALSGNAYIRWAAGSFSDVYTGVIALGHNELGNLSTQAGLAIAISNMGIINQGVQKTSVLVPHAANVATPTGLSVQVQTLIDDQLVVNEGVKKASKLIPHTTNIA